MRNIDHKKVMSFLLGCVTAIFAAAAASGYVDGQVTQANNPFLPDPRIRSASPPETAAISTPSISVIDPKPERPVVPIVYASTQRAPSPNVAADAVSRYLIGPGDKLLITIDNIERSSRIVVVGPDGSVDYPLAGSPIRAAGKTSSEVESEISSKVRIVSQPTVSVRVTEFVSHTVEVSGAVERPGTKFLQREAIPFFVLRAESIPFAGVNSVVIRRGVTGTTERFLLTGPAIESQLIFPGDSIEFMGPDLADRTAKVMGSVRNPGAIPINSRMTLTQLIEAAGGLNGQPTRATIKRSADGTKSITVEIKAVSKNKAADPEVLPGDTIEIG